jgi:hypothetical protein
MARRSKTTVDDEADDVVRTSPEELDSEQSEDGSSQVKPWDPNKIRITTKTFTLREVVDQISDKEIDLSPDFQRDFVWKERQRTRLVESILLGIPLPAFYFNQNEDGTYQVVDGVQRLSTISMFMGDKHVLSGHDLEYLNTLEACSYSSLETSASRRFKSTQIVVHIIEPQTPEDMKYDIFGRVNTLGSPLSAQEIRHAMSKPRSRQFLKELVQLEDFDKATEWQFWRKNPDGSSDEIRDSGRMANRELALRFCAFRTYEEAAYRQHASLDAFLVAFTKRIDGTSSIAPKISDRALQTLKSDFKRAMMNAHDILGKAAFRRWPTNQRRRGPINRALFEAQAIALADHKPQDLLPIADKLVESFRIAFSDPLFARAVTVGTGDPIAVTRRLTRAKEIVKEALQ